MTNPSPDLIQQVEAESVANDEQFCELLAVWHNCAYNPRYGNPRRIELIAHIDSIITARVAAATQQAYEAGRIAASPAAPAGQHDACYVEIAHLIGSIFFAGDFVAETHNERALESLLIKTGHRYTSWEEVAEATAAPVPRVGGNTNHIDALAAGQAAPASGLATFPLEEMGYAQSPDEKVIFGANDWKLTVGDVRRAKFQDAPAKAEGWISCGTALPDEHTEVLIWPHAGDEIVGQTRSGGKWGVMEYDSWQGWHWKAYSGPTHWHPLPEPADPSTPAKEPT